jgi:hypothetical protein
VLECKFSGIFLGIVHILTVIPISSREWLPGYTHDTAPCRTATSSIADELVERLLEALRLAILVQLPLPDSGSFI